jgi:predicted dehydrogenase
VFKKVLIIGKGSSGKNHFIALRTINRKFIIKSVSSRKFSIIFGRNLSKLIKFNPDYLVIATPSSDHYKFIKIIEKLFKNKFVLIEKPLFNKKFKPLNNIKNNYFVGYNLRYHAVLRFIKNYIKNKKVYFVKAECLTYLPDWRKINYKKSVSARKKLGGGVKLELSHEIDYLLWFFKDLKILYSFNKKISNLNINCDDILSLNASVKKNTFINLNLNFFSKISKREILINGKNFSLLGDLINNKVVLIKDNKKKVFQFKKFNILKSFIAEHNDLIKKNYQFICDFKQAIKTQKILDQIKISV